MNTDKKNSGFFTFGVLLAAIVLSGCRAPEMAEEAAPAVGPESRIGSLVEVVSVETVQLEGYGIVGGLRGTGSSECPPRIRQYLEGYILKELPERTINIKQFVDSHDTAVVLVEGSIPGTISKGEYFDVCVFALPGTQTTSLQGGWLYGAELKEARTFGITTKVLANASGPVYIDKIDGKSADKKAGYVLAGGTSTSDYRTNLVLRQPDYKIASTIRNRLNERFGSGTAKAISPSKIEFNVPWKYQRQKERFFSIIRSMYLYNAPEATQERIAEAVGNLVDSSDKHRAEIALEAIGNEVFGQLTAVLGSPDENVRLRAARCILNLGSDRGLDVLRQIAMDANSPYRIEALEAITRSARRNDAAAISRVLLRDDDFDARLAAYEELRRLDDIAIRQRLVGGSFYLETVAQTHKKAVFVSRSGQSRVALFGGPIKCRENIFIRSADGEITLNASPGDKYVSVMRKNPKQPNVVVTSKSSFELDDIIRTLCEEPDNKEHPGLAVSYAEMIAILKQMHDKGAVSAEFHIGPLPEMALNIKK